VGYGVAFAAPLAFCVGTLDCHPVGTLNRQSGVMDNYLIGAGAVLTAGAAGSITGASLHAQVDAGLSGQVQAAMVDFEAGDLSELSRVVIVATGWSVGRFEERVSRKLLAARECTLSDVFETLATATGAPEVHLFARWLPDSSILAEIANRKVRLIAHSLDAIGQAALISGQRYARWPAPLRAA
jgi:hypothetical protein